MNADLLILAQSIHAAAQRIVSRGRRGADVKGEKAFGRDLARARAALVRADARLERKRVRDV